MRSNHTSRFGRLCRHSATLAVAALASGTALALDGTWSASATSGALWGTATNWVSNTVGTGTGFTATFSPDIAADFTVDNNQQRAIGSLVFGTIGGTNSGNWLVSGSQITLTNGNSATNATITVNSLGSVTISGTIASGSANNALLVKAGTGKLILSNTGNSISNKISITAGTLEVSAERVLGATPGSFTADQLQISSGGTFRTTASATISANRGITIGSGGGTISANGGGLTIATRVTGAGNTATVAGANATTLTNTTGTATDVNWDFAPNSGVRTFFEGANALGTGSVRVRSGVRLTSQSVSSGTLANAVTLDSNAGLTARSSGGGLVYQNVIFPSSGTVQLNVDDQTTSTLTITTGGTLAGDLVVSTQQGGSNAVGSVFLDGVFSGAGGLVKTGTGASGLVILRGANTYTGTTAINTGTLQLGNGGAVGRLSASSAITGSAGATLVFNRSDTISSGTDFSSVIGGAINVTQSGSGTVVLAGTNAYTGKTSITNGTLGIGTATSLGANPGSFTADQLTISNSATLKTTAGITLVANRGITIGSGGGKLDVNGGQFIVNGRFTGDNQLVTATGSNGLTLGNATGGASNVDWDFALNSGQRVFFNNSNALGTGDVLVRNGIRLVSQSAALTGGQVTNAVTLESGAGLSARLSGSSVEYTNVTLPAAGSIVLNKDDLETTSLTILSGAALTGNLIVDTSQQAANAVGDVFLNGAFSGAGGLEKAGTGASGKLILGGVNLYTGYTTVSTGTLALAAAGSIASSARISVASGATFDVSAVAGYSLGAAQELNGAGTVLGAVTASGTIAPGSSGGVGTLAFANNLSMGGVALASYQLNGTDTTVGGGVNDLATVAGDFTLDGTLNVSETAANSFLSATVGNSWRLFNYTGALTNNGLVFGTMPALSGGLQFQVDTATANQVNLVIVVPEPATLAMAIAGLGAFGLRRRLRRLAR